MFFLSFCDIMVFEINIDRLCGAQLCEVLFSLRNGILLFSWCRSVELEINLLHTDVLSWLSYRLYVRVFQN
jgi:hypothetical protein